MGQTEILLEYQRLENFWDFLESQEYTDEIQKLLEDIGERQTAILNEIVIQ